MRIIYLLFILLVVFSSCNRGNKIPKEIIERPRMQELVWDMLRADVFLIDFAGKGDTAFNRTKESISLYQKVLAIHNTNKEQFKKSLTWYQRHPDVMKIIMDTLQSRQNNLAQDQVKPATVPGATDTASIKKNILPKRSKPGFPRRIIDSSKRRK